MKILRYLGSLSFVLGFFVMIFAGIPWYVVVADDPVTPMWLRSAVFLFLGGILVVLMSISFEQKKYKSSGVEEKFAEVKSEILLTNATVLPGVEIAEVLGLVQGHTVYAIWIGKDLSAVVRLILGGELTEYTEMMGKAREMATKKMLVEAENIGADAIINIRYMTTSVVGSAAELFAYGTAVKFKK